MMDSANNNQPIPEEVVTLVSHQGYYHLHRLLEGQRFLGFAHSHQSTLSIYRFEPAEGSKWNTYVNDFPSGAPYSASHIKELSTLTIAELIRRSTNGPIISNLS